MSLAKRLKSARLNVGLKQKQVSEQCGIDDSSLSSFENGHSEPRLSQLGKLAEVYHLPLSYFFVDSEPKKQVVMWRNKPKNDKEIESKFLQLCQQYRQLEVWTDEVSEKKLPNLDTGSNKFGYAEVQELASEAHKILGLGEHPGESLYWILEEVYSVKIFHMDLDGAGIAACAVSEEFGEAILLNKNCSRWRRNHDLAHELFHLLTWKRFGHPEGGVCDPTTKEDKFATCFAGSLLLPAEIVRQAILKATDDTGKIAFSKLDKISREFDVSFESLCWRMHYLFNWEVGKTKDIKDRAKEYVKTVPREDDSSAPLFPERYRALAIKALQESQISLGRFAKFMGLTRMEAERYLVGREPDYAEVPISVT
ncbi:MAG: helix-turn-helix domain-containing protein [Planctomycetota bacterium]|jgi:transcriptional regulator with XRE-family HTH domain/predicted HTH domain antitoxin